MKLLNDAAIITGGAQGIGRGIADELLQQGCSVIIADINEESAEKTIEDLNNEFEADTVAIHCDVTSASSVQAMVENAIGHFGNIGILVNNAGAAQIARTWEMPEEEWQQTMDVCLNGPFLCTKTVLNHMLTEGINGSIVNISSLNYTAATDGLSHYSAAKAGISQFTKAVAAEVGRYDIRVNAVAPGSTRTPLTENNGLVEGKIGEEFLSRTPLGRIGEPEDIAKVVVFLLSDYGQWITGETICVDGGQHIRGLHSYWDVLEEMGAFDE